MNHCILAIDQGTTSSRAIVFDRQANILAVAQQEFPQIYPQEGWVEHDPEAIWTSVLKVAREALKQAEKQGARVMSIGITNQRETTIIWDRKTGKPIYNAIVWQDRRTADTCRKLSAENLGPDIQHSTGLLLDPYFSATKVAWILDNVPGARVRAEQGELAFGTIDSFLIWRLTQGKVHATDATNASRTSLYNIHDNQWDNHLLKVFNVPVSLLPEVRDCAARYGESAPDLLGRAIPIAGVAGDQQAAAIGQCCFNPGDIKSTYGTGCFVLLNTGSQVVTSKNRLLSTIGYRLQGKTSYALEGSIFIAGAAIQWLRDELKIIDNAAESRTLAEGIDNTGGVYLVPAFAGMGPPYWDAEARGAILGLTRGSGRAEVVRAALESVCYQTADLLRAMADDGVVPQRLRVDGGMIANDWLVQYLADMLNLTIDRPRIMETTALGAAYLAGLQSGLYQGLDDLTANWQRQDCFTPAMPPDERERLIAGWQAAVRRVLS